MLSKIWVVLLPTALAPVLWGTTYYTSTTFLIDGHPLLAATLRALPAGLVLLAIARRLPRGDWWWKAVVLGALNIGAFFALLFIAAGRLPGGVAAVLGGIQPLLVSALASRVLAERVNRPVIYAGIGGVFGVALVVLRPRAELDALGVGAALLGALSMAAGVVLAKRWSAGEPPLQTTSWQLVAGGLMLALLTGLTEPLPSAPPSAVNVAGYAYLALAGTAVAYVLWFRGIRLLPARIPAFLGLLSPLVALAVGAAAAGETLTWMQAVGVVMVLGSVALVLRGSGRVETGVERREDTPRAEPRSRHARMSRCSAS